MPLSFATAASGARTASVSGRALHSGRDPLKEASRFLDVRARPSPSSFIVLGSCLGYLESVLASRYPGLKRISVQYDPDFRGKEETSVVDAWYPDSGQSLDAFLLSRLEPEDLDGLSVLEWPPAAQAYPEVASACLSRLRTAVLTMNGSANAMQAFGQARLLNALRSAVYGRRYLSPSPSSWKGSVVIAASGPSLEDNLASLSAARSSFYLIALSSAGMALARAGIKPDLLVSSDPGYWAALHLQGLPWKDVPLAFPLSARIPRRVLATWPLIAVCGREGFESAFSASIGLPALSLPETGTVAALALELASYLSEDSIAFCGLDLSSRDIVSHARPNAFEPFILSGSCRLDPEYSLTYAREASSEKRGPLRVSPQLATYAGYFSRAARRRSRIVSLASRSPTLNPLPPGELGPLAADRGLAPLHPAMKPGSSADPEKAKAAMKDLILGALDSLSRGARVEGLERSIAEHVSFSGLIALRKALRSGDAASQERILGEIAERGRRLLSRVERVLPLTPDRGQEPGP